MSYELRPHFLVGARTWHSPGGDDVLMAPHKASKSVDSPIQDSRPESPNLFQTQQNKAIHAIQNSLIEFLPPLHEGHPNSKGRWAK
jgi:hypothetical protein